MGRESLEKCQSGPL